MKFIFEINDLHDLIRCHLKQSCSLNITVETFGDDPCPLVDKFLEVGFYCDLNEIRVLEEHENGIEKNTKHFYSSSDNPLIG